jgi:hypothetical protein
MDPFLEDQGRWNDFHASMITYCRDSLSERLPEGYVAQIGEAVSVVTWEAGRERPMLPDVAVIRSPGPGGSGPGSPSSIATLEPVSVPLAVATDEVRDTWVEIRRLPDERLVTAIEILSPTNKGSSGLDEYRDKRQRLLSQPVNLVEIDLLLAGRRLPMGKPLPPGDFYAIISRASDRQFSDVYAWSIRLPLPTIPIPLEDPDPNVPLDLAALLALAYERGRYSRLIRYHRPLDLPLQPEDKHWAEGIARGAVST